MQDSEVVLLQCDSLALIDFAWGPVCRHRRVCVALMAFAFLTSGAMKEGKK